MSKKNLLVFAGSCRRQSHNGQLAAATAKIAESKANVTLLNLADYPAPIYNGDDEESSGMPETIKAFRQQMRACDGFIVVTPEYNGHVPPLLVNTFGWASRTAGDPVQDNIFVGKTAAVMAASPGRLGGIRVIPRLRDTLTELKVMVVPGFVTLGNAGQAFNDDGSLVDDSTAGSVDALIELLLQHC